MRRRRSRNLDPRWIETRFQSRCSACGRSIPKGTDAFYYPATKNLYGKACCDRAETNAREFLACAFDDTQMHYQFTQEV